MIKALAGTTLILGISETNVDLIRQTDQGRSSEDGN